MNVQAFLMTVGLISGESLMKMVPFENRDRVSEDLSRLVEDGVVSVHRHPLGNVVYRCPALKEVSQDEILKIFRESGNTLSVSEFMKKSGYSYRKAMKGLLAAEENGDLFSSKSGKATYYTLRKRAESAQKRAESDERGRTGSGPSPEAEKPPRASVLNKWKASDANARWHPVEGNEHWFEEFTKHDLPFFEEDGCWSTRELETAPGEVPPHEDPEIDMLVRDILTTGNLDRGSYEVTTSQWRQGFQWLQLWGVLGRDEEGNRILKHPSEPSVEEW